MTNNTPDTQDESQEKNIYAEPSTLKLILIGTAYSVAISLIGAIIHKKFIAEDNTAMVYIKGDANSNIVSNGFINSDEFLKKLVAEDCWTASTLHHKGNTERAGRTDTYVCAKSDSVFKASDRKVAEQRELKNHINDMSIEDFQERSAIIQLSHHKYCEVNKQSKFCS